MDAEALAARIWPGRDVRLEPLGGGITNHNFKVDVDGESFVLRIGGRNTHLLGIDRRAEHAATTIAAELGVGPEVVEFTKDCLVTRFIDGQPVPVEEMHRRDVLREVATLLRRVHGGPAFPAEFDAFRVIEEYHHTAVAHGVKVPSAYHAAKKRADEIERELGTRTTDACHNDLLNANFIRGADGIRIVDWEYAGMGDLFFDLANFSINHELGPERDEFLLDAYFGDVTDDHREHLRSMHFMSDFREAMWGVVQQGISDLDFDFEEYATKHFERALT